MLKYLNVEIVVEGNLSRLGRGLTLLVGMKDEIEEVRKSSNGELFQRMMLKKKLLKLLKVVNW